MENISYNLIEPLLVNSQVEGSRVYCTFRTPSGELIESFGKLKRSRSIEGQMRQKATKMVSRQARRIASRSVRSVLGGGFLGRMGSQLVRSAATPENVGVSGYGTAEKHEGIIDAFQKVADKFHLDQETGQWREAAAMPTNIPAPTKKIRIGARKKMTSRRAAREEKKASEEQSSTSTPAPSRFQTQMTQAPISSNYDKEILARILVELANADGKISREEKQFLNDIIDPSFGSIDDLLRKDPVSQIECEEVSSNVKENIFLLAWTVALADFTIEPEEEELLLEYADMLGLSSARREDLVKIAKFNMLENAISSNTSRSELFELASQIQLSNDDAERCLIDLKKRN